MATATLGVKVSNNYAEHVTRLESAPSRLTRAMQGATVDSRRVMSQQVERDLVAIAGGKYWDVISSVNPTNDGATARVFTPESKPHPIDPKKPDGYLRFVINGREVFTKHVDHPGSAPPDWLVRFKESAPELIKRNYSGAIQRTLARL